MVKKLLVAGNPLLKKKAEYITDDFAQLPDLVAEMAATLKYARGLGLAAPQIGVSKRVIILDTGYLSYDSLTEEEKENHGRPVFTPEAFINPEIVSREGTVEIEEGCLSVPGYRAVVDRSSRLRVKYRTMTGELVERDVEGLWAIAFQHEIDHLDGLLFIDRISRLKRNIALKKVKKYMDEVEEGDDETDRSLYGQS